MPGRIDIVTPFNYLGAFAREEGDINCHAWFIMFTQSLFLDLLPERI